MKKLMLIAALIIMANFCFAQKLQKGNLLGLHIITVSLKPNVTMDQFTAFYIAKVIPEYEKQFKGTKGYVVKGIRGENKNSFGIIWLFENEQARDKYFGTDEAGTPTDLGKKTMENVNAIDKELEKYGTSTSVYTDWVVQ